MHALAGLLAAAPTVTPSPTPTVNPDLVTPGPGGFVAIAFLAVAVVLLVWDMLRRIRRARYREEVVAELDAEAETARAVRDTDVGDQAVDGGDRPASG